MLPFELLALIFLASVTRASPQPQNHIGANTTSAVDSSTFAFVHVESTVTSFGTDGPKVTFLPIPVVGVSETGLDDSPSTTTSEVVWAGTSLSSYTIVTETPVIVTVHTETDATSIDSIYTPRTLPPAGSSASSSQTGSGNELLTEIVSALHALPSGTPSASTTNNDKLGGAGNTASNSAYTTLTQQNPQGTLLGGGTITLDSTVITLTPGLSTTVGGDGHPTFISLTTDGVGQTMIVISSSGTAISATVSQVPMTMTAPATGFEATPTAEARPGVLTGPSSGVAATTTAHKGAAEGSLERTGWSLSIIGGFIAMFSIV